MRYQYLVILKKGSERATDLLSGLLCLFSVISFFYFPVVVRRASGISGTGKRIGVTLDAHTYFLFAAALILLAGVVVNLVLRRRGRQVRYRYLLLVAGVGWIGMTTMPWVAAFYFLLAFLEYQTKRPLEIGFDKDVVVINTLIKRRFGWADFNNIILKDGLLTLDFVSNRLLQKEVADDEEEDDADEEEFNAYCRERLAVSRR